MNKPVAIVIVLVALTASYVVVVLPVRASGDFWVSRTRLPILIRDLAAVAVNGEIYAVGNTYTDTYNYVYDPPTDVWVSKTPMPTAQHEFGIATYQNKIYVIGGWITDSTGSTVMTGANQVYDPANDTWETKAPMPWARGGLQANVVDGKIYLIGGRLQNGGVSDVNKVYDTSTDSWTTMAPIPTPVYEYGSAVVDNKIYVIGGNGGVNAGALVQIYDPETNNWTSGKPLPAPAGMVAAAATIGVFAPTRIYVIGTPNGYFGLTSTDTTQIYDLQSNSWTTGASIPAPDYISFSTVVINDTLYAMGGRPFGPGPGGFGAVNEQYFPLGFGEPPASSSPAISPTPNPTASPSPTPSPTPLSTSTPSPLPTSTPLSTASPSPSPSVSQQPTASPEAQATLSLSAELTTTIGVTVVVVAISIAVLIRKKKAK